MMILYPLNDGDNGRLQNREEAVVRERERETAKDTCKITTRIKKKQQFMYTFSARLYSHSLLAGS
jgi:hypothetical protein